MSKKNSKAASPVAGNLLAKIDALTAEVKSLREQIAAIKPQVNHTHYHYDREPDIRPPVYPATPWITWAQEQRQNVNSFFCGAKS